MYKLNQQKNSDNSLLITLLLVIILVSGGLAAVLMTRQQNKQVKNVTMSAMTVSKSSDHYTFDAYCDTEFKDGSKARESLGRVTLTGESAYGVNYQTNKCDTSR